MIKLDLRMMDGLFFTEMVTEVRRKVPEGMGELLDMIRVCSVETVESITKWRKALVSE